MRYSHVQLTRLRVAVQECRQWFDTSPSARAISNLPSATPLSCQERAEGSRAGGIHSPRRHTLSVFAAFAIVCTAPSPIVAQVRSPSRPPTDTISLSLGEARRLAVRANPELRAATYDIDIARGEMRQAGLILRSNPEADVLAGSRGAEIGLGQEFEFAGQRGARRAAGRAGIERATASVTDVARRVLNDAEHAFYRFVAADRRLSLAEEILGLNQRLADVSQRRLQAGQISRLEFNLAIVEFGRSRGRALAARRQREEVMSELRRLLGLEATRPVVPLFDSTLVPAIAARDMAAVVPVPDTTPSSVDHPLLSIDSLTDLALSRRPDLAEGSAGVRQAEAQVSIARREAFPNLLLRVSSQRVEGASTRELRPGVGITLPVFNWNQGEIQARRAATRQAEVARAGIAARVRSQVFVAVASYTSAAEETRVLETTVLAPARENRRLLEIAFREGKVGLPVLLLIRNQVIDAELEYWEAWLAEHEALADLGAATGESVVGFTPSVGQ